MDHLGSDLGLWLTLCQRTFVHSVLVLETRNMRSLSNGAVRERADAEST